MFLIYAVWGLAAWTVCKTSYGPYGVEALSVSLDVSDYTFNSILVEAKKKIKENVDDNTESLSPQCSSVPLSYRFDCIPAPDATSDECFQRGCCWEEQSVDADSRDFRQRPFCYYPNSYVSHKVTNISYHDYGVTAFYKRIRDSGYPDDVDDIKLEITFLKGDITRVKVVDPIEPRFEYPFLPPVTDEDRMNVNEVEKTDIGVQIANDSFGFRIYRKSTGESLFNNIDIGGGLIFSNQLLQISTLLPSHFIYGLGERTTSFLKSTSWSHLAFWNRDQAPERGTSNLYGSHPFYLSLDEQGNAHGVFLKNSHCLEVVLQPTPSITFRALGGILDFYIMSGPTPIAVIEQYTTVIGQPFLPPYWSLGYQQCKFGYGSLNRTKEVLQQTRAAGIPLDVQWNDIDYMDEKKDFTYDKDKFHGLPEFVNELHREGLHYVQIVDPGISNTEPNGTYPPYDKGYLEGIFIENASGFPFVGKVWNTKTTVWPDFTHPKAQSYWGGLLSDYHERVPIDGVWIDMNEPSNFWDGEIDGCPLEGKDGQLNNPYYVPRNLDGGSLFRKTVCPSARHHMGRHYEVHNVYSLAETILTSTAMRHIRNKKRAFILSRSTAPGHGHYGAHWTGDVYSTWDALKDSITGLMNFNMFGVPMVGADICGFNGNTTVNLCLRWMQLGAFYPFSRNHNSDDCIDQDPVSLGPQVVRASLNALNARYRLLPFFYTQMVKAHLNGTPPIRPLLFNFVLDRKTYAVDTQFMWAENLMVLPVLEENSSTVTGYFPEDIWYDYYGNMKPILSKGEYLTINAPLDRIPLFIRGGSILPLQRNASTTTESRKNPFFLRVYLPSETQNIRQIYGGGQTEAKGEWYHDDGESVDSYNIGAYHHVTFSSSVDQTSGKGWIKSFIHHSNSTLIVPHLTHISVHGIKKLKNVTQVELDGKVVSFYTGNNCTMLGIARLSVDFTKAFKLRWS